MVEHQWPTHDVAQRILTPVTQTHTRTPPPRRIGLRGVPEILGDRTKSQRSRMGGEDEARVAGTNG